LRARSGFYGNETDRLRWLPPAALERVATREPGDALRLMFDVQNVHNRQAVAVRTESDRTLIGYFPRYLAHDAWKLVFNCDPTLMHLSGISCSSTNTLTATAAAAAARRTGWSALVANLLVEQATGLDRGAGGAIGGKCPG
jgi:hypothetical protein